MKTILIAGATSMIGKACADLMGKEENTLVLLSKNESALETLSESIEAACFSYAVDFSDSVLLQGKMQEIVERHPIDAYIHNTAIYPWKRIEDLSWLDFEETLQISLTSALIITRTLIPHFRKQQAGRIVYLSSIAGEVSGAPNMAAYSAAKTGLNGFMRTCALEMAPFNVCVNSILPGKIYDPETLSEEERQSKLRNVPLQRFISPYDIAHLVDFLISDKAKNITGQTFTVDGGQSIDHR